MYIRQCDYPGKTSFNIVEIIKWSETWLEINENNKEKDDRGWSIWTRSISG